VLLWSERSSWLHCKLARRHLVLGILVELRQETWVGRRLLLSHSRVAKLTQSPHRVTQTQGTAKLMADGISEAAMVDDG